MIPFKFHNSTKGLSFLMILFISFNVFAQNTIDEVIEKYNDGSVVYISVEKLDDLLKADSHVILLDARSFEEYKISHLKNAQYVGYEDFDIEKIKERYAKDETLVVYCSIGVRSEQIGEQLQSVGFQKIYNLYGGIFKWFNAQHPIYNPQNQKTNRIHAYSSFWGEFIKGGEKVYE